MPSSSASRTSESGRSRPEPEGPPTTATVSVERSSGCWSSSTATPRSITSGALSGWIRPTKVIREPSAGRPRRARRRRADVAERGQVHAGVDHLDATGVGVVQVDQLPGLVVGVRHEHVGRGDHLLLADQPRHRLGGVAHGHRGVLDLRHRVHRVHQRDAPPVARQRAHLAAEPVVAVHEVVVAGRVVGLGAQDLAREDAQLGRQLVLGEPLVGPGRDVVDADAVADVDDGRQHAPGRPGEHVHLDLARREPTGELEDVDVHPACVTRARLVQGRGVQADHGHPAQVVLERRDRVVRQVVRHPYLRRPNHRQPSCIPLPIMTTLHGMPVPHTRSRHAPHRRRHRSQQRDRRGHGARARRGRLPRGVRRASSRPGRGARAGDRRHRDRAATSPTQPPCGRSRTRCRASTCWSTTPAAPSTRPRSRRPTSSSGRRCTT